MDIQSLISVQTIFLSLAIGILTYFIRTGMEVKYPKLPENKAYGKIFLPLLSCVIGVLLCLFSQMLPGFLTSTKPIDKVLLGIIAGWMSSFVFRIARTFLAKEGGEVPYKE